MSARISRKGSFWLCAGVLAGCAVIAATLLLAPAARAAFTLSQFDTALEENGKFTRQAGSHPDLFTKVTFTDEVDLNDNVKDVLIDLPPGMVGNPSATDKCTMDELVGKSGSKGECLPTSQIGILNIYGSTNAEPSEIKLFNMDPPSNLPALFGFNYQGVIGRIEPHLRPSDYAISTTTLNISAANKLAAAEVTIWGVPAETSHERFGKEFNIEIFDYVTVPDRAVRRPFLTAPTSCPASPTSFFASIDSWQDPGTAYSASRDTDRDELPYLWDGCERLRFDPSFTASPGSHAADSPTGLDVDVKVPQDENPDGLATAHVRKTVVTLPKGFAISPSAATGLGACSEAQIGLGSNDPVACPGSSQIGSLKVKSPLLDEELEGEVYLAAQHENPFGSLLAMYLAIKGPGILVKVPGKVEADPVTGQLTTSFDNLPQLPFSELKLSLNGGPKAPLTTPSSCGTYDAQMQMTSWASPIPIPLTAPLVITEGCDTGGFSPALRAGTSNPVGGAFSPFTLQVLRGDGEANLSRIEATLPEGLLAKLAGVPLCGDAQAASGDCPAASKIGATTVAAGAGSNPVSVPQPGKAPTAIYLAGPYHGAPYSLVVKVPAQAGPFDLGTVTVRNALEVDPATTQVTAISDPLPQILQGIPIAYRDVKVEVNRDQFTVNPTSCDPMRVTSRLTSVAGQIADPSSRFQATGCGELGFKPSLAISLKGKMNRTGNPALTAVLKAPKGQANIARTAVVLPKPMFIDNAHINNPCTRVQFNEGACPKGSVLGRATAYSPLLDQPLSGPVYFRSNGGARELPDLVADLNGPIHVTLVGFIDSVKAGKEGSRVRTRFQNVPDAPVSKFVLRMAGGKRGLLENSIDLCSRPQRAEVLMDGQNGKTADRNLVIKTSCGKAR